ncbi:hypothetical protein HYQ46_011801 [Verticillium longisporum]|nr:hypothetical protein HYQ46_011801 [Verticillium longisporum]
MSADRGVVLGEEILIPSGHSWLLLSCSRSWRIVLLLALDHLDLLTRPVDLFCQRHESFQNRIVEFVIRCFGVGYVRIPGLVDRQDD